MQDIWYLNAPEEKGPFDIIGDVHGCFTELQNLLNKLGWVLDENDQYIHPKGRKLCFVGDLVDRGPNTPSVLRLVMDLLRNQRGFCTQGNHDDKLARYLKGHKVTISYGLEESIEQLKKENNAFKKDIQEFITNLPIYMMLDEGKLLIAHAGLRENLHYQNCPRARAFALYGKPTGKYDEKGYPIRYRWQDEYQGKPTIVYGHVPINEVEAVNNCINIDTSCVFGGKLTALRWPEMEYINVKSQFQSPIQKRL